MFIKPNQIDQFQIFVSIIVKNLRMILVKLTSNVSNYFHSILINIDFSHDDESYMFIEDNAIYIKSTILNTKNLKIYFL